MARLHIIYDPKEKIQHPKEEDAKRLGIRTAVLDLPDDLLDVDVTSTARKLADLLLSELKKG